MKNNVKWRNLSKMTAFLLFILNIILLRVLEWEDLKFAAE